MAGIVLGELHEIITYDGGIYYPLNDGENRFVLTTTPGNLGLPDFEWITERRYKQDGVSEVSYRAEPRRFYIEHRYQGAGREAFFAARTALINAVRPNRAIFPDPKPALLTYIFVMEDGTQRALQGRAQTPKFPASETDSWDEWGFSNVLEIECWEPSLFDPNEQTYDVPATAATELAFPISFPIYFLDDNIIASGVVPYVGNWYSYPTLQVTGPCTSFTVVHQELNKFIYFLFPVISGETVTIDLYNRTVLSSLTDGFGDPINRFADLGPLSDLQAFRLEPQPVVAQNTLDFYAPGSSSILASYDSSNQSEDVQLQGLSGAGATESSGAQTGTNISIGTVGGTTLWRAQSFTCTTGTLSQLTFTLRANTGAPTGGLTWQIVTDNAGVPGTTILAAGAIAAPTASALNTVPVTGGPVLMASTTYWLVLFPTVAQPNGNAWNWDGTGAGTYPNGNVATSSNDGATWVAAAAFDVTFSITTAAIVPNTELAQSFVLSDTASVGSVTLLLKKTGTPAGTLTFRLETDAGGTPSGTLVDAAATDTLAESSLITAYSTYTFEFASGVTLSGGLTYWLVLETDRSASNTDYVEWGAGSVNDLPNAELQGLQSAVWTPLSLDGCFSVIAESTVGLEIIYLNRFIGF